MNWEKVLAVVGVVIFTGQLFGQSSKDSRTCEELLFRDQFKNIRIPIDRRRDDILYLKVVRKQFDAQVSVKSLNSYSDYEEHISAIYDDADISCLAIGEAFELMIVLDIEVKSDSLINLPESKEGVDSLTLEFAKELGVPANVESMVVHFSGIKCGPNPEGLNDYDPIKSPAQLITEELEKLRQPIKLKKN